MAVKTTTRFWASIGTPTEEQLKKAYRKLAMKYHPTATREINGRKERFKEVNEAYAVAER